jgi:hypothetical protein
MYACLHGAGTDLHVKRARNSRKKLDLLHDCKLQTIGEERLSSEMQVL